MTDHRHPIVAQIGRLARAHPGMLTVGVCYVGYYGFIIAWGRGVPYVMDNNETFSAILHAQNLWTFNFFDSFGLADDATSPFSAAHPIVHTHQGDFPRLFAFILYGLGFRSAVSQILITTFTVGLAAVGFMQAFFRRVAGDLFATLATLLLISDYLLFAQWQVDVYRVWHCFFLFGALLCVYGLNEWRRRRWFLLTVLLYAGLLYWELVFASFVAVTVACYTIWIYRRKPLDIVLAGLVQGLGATLGLAVLVVQAVLYLKWQGFLQDLQFTYGARNFAGDPQQTLMHLKEFYDAHNVTFWYNIQTSEPFRLLSLLRSIFVYVLQVQTPLFATLCLGLAGASLLSDSRLPGPRDTWVADAPINSVSEMILMPGFFTFVAIVAYGIGDGSSLWSIDRYVLLASSLLLVFSAGALSVAARRVSAALSVSGAPADPMRCIVASIYLTCLGGLVAAEATLYEPTSRALWLELLTPVPSWAGKLVICVAGFAGAMVILTGKRAILGRWYAVPAAIAPFLVTGGLGYLFVFVFNPGYLYSGYLLRLCPLPVFHVDTLLALGFFVPLAAFASRFSGKWSSHGLYYPRLAVAGVGGVGLAALGIYWAVLQYRYMDLIPPNQFAFTNKLIGLAQPADGIVSNTYAAPFGLIANTWAYQNGDLLDGNLGALQGGRSAAEYLWFADRRSNPAYRRPGFFVCFEQLAVYPLQVDQDDPRAYAVKRCPRLPAKVDNGEPHGQNPKVTLVNRDQANGLWAIYRLEWP